MLTRLVSLSLLVLLSACNSVEEAQNGIDNAQNKINEVAKTAQDTHNTVQNAARTTIAQIDKTKVLADLALAVPAVQAYHLQNQKYPASLAELNLKLNVPQDLTYDPATGKITSKTFPNLK